MKNLNLDALDSPFRAIYEEAYLAGKKARDEYFAKHGEPLYCGLLGYIFLTADIHLLIGLKK